MMRFLLLATLLFVVRAAADTGVLIPISKQAPDPTVLSLDEISIEIAIDNGDAHIHLVQIFANHTATIEEGTFQFALPASATVSDFAVWDGPVRIPAVILERRRADEIYEKARNQAIDPGLLQMAENVDATPARTSLFSARIVPIPPYGTKRLELDYHQRLAMTDFKQFFALPLQPDAGGKQVVHRFMLTFDLQSAMPLDNLQFGSKLYPLKLTRSDAEGVTGSFTANDVPLNEDFSATWTLRTAAADQLTLITHRDPTPPQPDATETAPERTAAPEPGFFEAQVLLASPQPVKLPSRPHTLILLFDNSLSMQWEKLERSYAALEAALRSLQPENPDQFNLLLFNQTVTPFQPHSIPATAQSVQQALNFVRASKLRGGTDLAGALTAALAQVRDENTTLVVLTDGDSDRGESVLPAKVAATYKAAWNKLTHPPHTVIFAVGDDANIPLLRQLARNDGFVETILSTESIEFKVRSFVSKLALVPVGGLRLNAPAANLVYPLDDAVYPGSVAQWVGQYRPVEKDLAVGVTGIRDSTSFEVHASLKLPTVDLHHPQLPRLWAQARVDALLDQINRDGESTAAIDEIIRLSRQYKFVTPYTSFLAAPRSLLRPRVIRPGDPVLRVRTDTAIESVIALFPFGLTKPLRHLASEDLHAPDDKANRLWETRFLAPPDMRDGTYNVRLLLRDTHGNLYRENKSFVIASTPPVVKLHLSRTRLHRGETLAIAAAASASTRTLIATLEGAAPVQLRWNAPAATNTGVLQVPLDLPIGRYPLRVTAEDIAHNIATEEVEVDVIP